MTVKETQPVVIERPSVQEKIELPKLYKVVLWNNAALFPLVIKVLCTIFGLNRGEATLKMLTAHYGEKSIIGIYPKDTADTKIQQALSMAHDERKKLKFLSKKYFEIRFTSERE